MITLKQPLGRSSTADLFDVWQVKTALGKLSYYEPYDNEEITGFADNQLFEGIRRFQKDQNLFPSGAINPEDKTLESLNNRIQKRYVSDSREVEPEELPPLLPKRPMIPGTNIPYDGVEEGQMPRRQLGAPAPDICAPAPDKWRYKIDRGMERIPPDLFDNRMLLPYDSLFPTLQKGKGKRNI